MIRHEIEIPAHHVIIKGDLSVPYNARGLVIFSHGSGSSRLSPRNKLIAEFLQRDDFATLLFDLLTEEEDQLLENRFNIALLTERLVTTTIWIRKNIGVEGLPVGYFGASTGAASALQAAALLGRQISAVVSRGGRPDLALPNINKVMAPTLLIIGQNYSEVLTMNQKALQALHCEKSLKIISGASHLFEEPGKLEEVAELAGEWYKVYLKKQEKATV